MPQISPVVFVVDDDISVRESLEMLIRCEGWQPQPIRLCAEFLCCPGSSPRVVLCSTFAFLVRMGWTCRSASQANGPTCQSFSLQVMAMSP